jgi:sugar/nucleoside kinase (ribokinase family)
MTMDRPIALVVGAASRDLTTADPRGWRLGGTATYASLALARLGIEVWALVGVDRLAATARELDLLRAAGVVLTLAELPSGPVFENVETPVGRRQRCLSIAEPMALTTLPRAWTSGFDALVLGPVAGELDDSWALLAGTAPGPFVALGWQGLLRTLRAGADVQRVPPASSDLLGRADLVVASGDDFEPGIRPGNLLPFLAPSATLVLTAAEEGGEILARDPSAADRAAVVRSSYPAIPSDAAVDPTGAGDVFLAAMVAACLVPGLGPAALVAAAAASLAVEAPGLLGVPDLDAIRRRMTRAPSLASRRPSDTSSRTSGRPSQA